MSGFGKKAFGVDDTPKEDIYEQSENTFKRDESDNKLFPQIQVKDITDIITEDCVGAWDFDGVVYRVCANMETLQVKVEHKEQDVSEILPNVTAFKGRGKKISETSWLGVKNLERELENKPAWKVDDFTVTQFQELKMDKEKAIEQAKIQILMKIKQVKQQYRIPSVLLLLGGGASFRENLDQAKMYKGGRQDSLRPLLLKDIRDWVLKDLNSEYCSPLEDGRVVEADDISCVYGVMGYKTYMEKGKFDYLELSPDKDALAQSGKLLINPDTHTGENNPLRGKFKYPQAMLIHTSNKDVGDVELEIKGGAKSTSKVFRGYSFKYLMYQAILGKDQADSYNCLGDIGISLGDVEAYKLLKPCKTAKETLQVCLDVAYEKTPYGVQYTSHKGEDLDVDTLTYLNNYFQTAMMLRSRTYDMDLFKLCKAFKVDTSKVVGNNKLTPPVKTFTGDEQHLKQIEDLIKDILENNVKGLKSKKKADQAPMIDEIKSKLESITFESHYEMIQKEK